MIEDHIPGLPVTAGLLEFPGGIVIFPPLATQVDDRDFCDADAKLDAAGEGTVTCTQAALGDQLAGLEYEPEPAPA